MPVKYVQVRHDDDQWYEAELLDQHRSGGRWRPVVRYTVAPGMRYVRGECVDELRAAESATWVSVRSVTAPMRGCYAPS